MATRKSLRVERVPAPIRSRVTDNLRRAIISREFQPGERLIERELVEMTGVSRTSIREALRELAAEGLVSTTPNKGTAVTTLSAKEASELYQMRSVLEGLAGRLFVENATEAQKRALAKQVTKLERLAKKGARILDAKDEFYRILFEGAGNDTLRATVSSLHARVTYLRSLSLSTSGRPQDSVVELHAIADAVMSNDAGGAEKGCSEHVEQARLAAMLALESLEPTADGRKAGRSSKR
ncbi:MAG: FCD domain-containing protein [Streptosporangiales bacterium]|nr:FCD domain-containing protein [Streptosporangiales bacterium]